MEAIDWRNTTLHSMFAPSKRKNKPCHNFSQIKPNKSAFKNNKRFSMSRIQERHHKILKLIGKLQKQDSTNDSFYNAAENDAYDTSSMRICKMSTSKPATANNKFKSRGAKSVGIGPDQPISRTPIKTSNSKCYTSLGKYPKSSLNLKNKDIAGIGVEMHLSTEFKSHFAKRADTRQNLRKRTTKI